MRRKIIYLVICMLLCLVSCKKEEAELLTLDEAEEVLTETEETASESIYVYVCGAVVSEGVYELPVGSRCHEAIALAGGFCEDAATTSINQAEILKDEATLYVPTIQELSQSQSEDDGKVNINTASKEELMTLPGVGEAKAESILQYREENGSFKTIEDIMQISGIKEGLFAKIKDYIKV